MGDIFVLCAVVVVLVAIGMCLWVYAEKLQQISVRLMGHPGGRRGQLIKYAGSPQNRRNIRFSGALMISFAALVVALWVAAGP